MANKRFFWVVGVVVALLLMGGGYLAYSQQSKAAIPSNPTNSNQETVEENAEITDTSNGELISLQACDLIFPEELQDVLGELMLDPTQTEVTTVNDLEQQTCTFLPASGKSQPEVTLVYVYPATSDQDKALEAAWQSQKQAASNAPGYVQVTDLGKGEAFYTTAGGLELYVLTEKITIKVQAADSSKNLDLAKGVAKKVLLNY